MKILFATDGSVNADNALQSILEREWPEGSLCRVVTVAEPLNKTLSAALFGIGDLATRAQAEMEKDLQTLLTECVDKLTPKFGAGNVSSELIKGQPKVELLQAAGNWHSDLIVIGSHGNDPDDNWFSSVTRTLISSAPCSVEMLNTQTSISVEQKEQQHTAVKPSRILIAVSDQQNAKQIIDSVLARPWPAGSLFRVISVVNPAAQKQSRFFKSKEIEEMRTRSVEEKKKGAELLVKETASRLESKFPAAQLTYHALEGSPRNVILQVAQDWPADLIMIGSHEHDHDRLEHFLGSTASSVVWNAECSVELVKLSKVPART